MKPKDYINKKAAEEALKAYQGTQLNNNQETSPYFVGKINADRTKITDPTGRVYNLKFTGNPKEYELAQRLSNDTAVVNATPGKTINVDGGRLKPIFLLSPNTNFPFDLVIDFSSLFLATGKHQQDISQLFSTIDCPETEDEARAYISLLGKEYLGFRPSRMAKLSKDGRNLILIKLCTLFFISQDFSSLLPIVVHEISNLGGFCGVGGCRILETEYEVISGIIDGRTTGSVTLMAFDIYTNINFSTDGEVIYSKKLERTLYQISEDMLDNIEVSGLYAENEDFPSGDNLILGPSLNEPERFINPYCVDAYFDFKNEEEYELLLIGRFFTTDNQFLQFFGAIDHPFTPGEYCVNPAVTPTICETEVPVPTDNVITYSDFPYYREDFSYGMFLYTVTNTLTVNKRNKFLLFNDASPDHNFEGGTPERGFVQAPAERGIFSFPPANEIVPLIPARWFMSFNPVINRDTYAIPIITISSVPDPSSVPITELIYYTCIVREDTQTNSFLEPYSGSVLAQVDLDSYPGGGATLLPEAPNAPIVNDLDTFYSYEQIATVIPEAGQIMYYKGNQYICWCPTEREEADISYETKLLTIPESGEVMKVKDLKSSGIFKNMYPDLTLWDMALRG